MRKLLIVLLMLIAGVAHARILHVGENTIKLSQTKTTNPALHVRVGGDVWYGMMVPTFVKNTLHVRYNNMEYSVLQCTPFTDTTNYTYDESGRLIGANENLYLESTGTQYIDTLHIPTLVTRSEMDIRFSDKNYIPDNSATHNFFGIYDYFDTKSSYGLNFGAPNQPYSIYTWLCAFNGSGGPLWCNSKGPIIITQTEKTTKQTVILDAKNSYAQYGTKRKDLHKRQTTEKESIFLFGANETYKDGIRKPPAYNATDGMYIYNTKIYEDDVLVRHFVPVPCGLKIGDFIVPENGMWDIVEQKFYGNMGTGEFIYGVDG